MHTHNVTSLYSPHTGYSPYQPRLWHVWALVSVIVLCFYGAMGVI